VKCKWRQGKQHSLRAGCKVVRTVERCYRKWREIYKSARAQIFSHYDSANELLRKRNSDRYREPQQRCTKPQTGHDTCDAFHSHLNADIRTPHPNMCLFNRS